MFNNEFYRLCDQLHGELQSLYRKYPDMDPSNPRLALDGWARAGRDAAHAVHEFTRALAGLAQAASGVKLR